eukprot:405452-Alexandrium_andersonii.AAC.1
MPARLARALLCASAAGGAAAAGLPDELSLLQAKARSSGVFGESHVGPRLSSRSPLGTPSEPRRNP